MSSECDNCTSSPRTNNNPPKENTKKKGWILIDPKKVKTLEDVILILEHLQVAVDPKHDGYKKIKHLLVDH